MPTLMVILMRRLRSPARQASLRAGTPDSAVDGWIRIGLVCGFALFILGEALFKAFGAGR